MDFQVFIISYSACFAYLIQLFFVVIIFKTVFKIFTKNIYYYICLIPFGYILLLIYLIIKYILTPPIYMKKIKIKLIINDIFECEINEKVWNEFSLDHKKAYIRERILEYLEDCSDDICDSIMNNTKNQKIWRS